MYKNSIVGCKTFDVINKKIFVLYNKLTQYLN